MGSWLDIKDAPRDGTVIRSKIPGYGSDNRIAWHYGFVGSDDGEAGAWVWVDQSREPPPSWCDGVCWAVNSHNEPSVWPTHWKHKSE